MRDASFRPSRGQTEPESILSLMNQPAVTDSRDTENQHKDASFGTAQRATLVPCLQL
jgi:hypothetical protein